MTTPKDYKSSGVDIEVEEKSINALVSIIKETLQFRKGKIGAAIGDIGSYSGFIEFGDYALSLATDGVGSKVLVAQKLRKYDTVGIDVIAMNVNDVICNGATPLAFVDYIALEKTSKYMLNEIAKGLLEGAKQSDMPIVGGETATLPDIIKGNGEGFDLAGTCLGVVKKEKIISGKDIAPGDVIIGIESSGIHSNGLTLARKILGESDYPELLVPTRIYVKQILDLIEHVKVKGMAHITGSGLLNLKRLKKGIGFDLNLPEPPMIFKKIMDTGVEIEEMYKTFNMGTGFVVIISEEDVNKALQILNKYFPSYVIGKVIDQNIIRAYIKGLNKSFVL
ncbi:MAG TPA: phosphoribosylformylglycinamidine cyclo-ligase [Methanofastidiosum sp.]|jgi:phosphoribosylformylglycinamidine cyclo-ligase|uniref:Phosphoribosylformylglycinamidine cyclo-ligase n=1 Tax=Candidatus Methanofastidiosum methylothiophilum TaxID=1705564 RepID=A0A150JL85_9EURY|nr:MAG: phosphoribosylaminoimidazole synthetase [Candidatus Methanofastidiosum methylthiophilus]HOE92490.1 phosphoribosylformylglycinamidine cyclo-ligase [Methanofastidiosum sp.]HOR88559.1 phosphoribosylformylglycinamidine cyclo-ligase [Methanofastidiosum sp.]HPL00282.1 phosphoribosylformylglycinamidine cyclo-ligase [Methanofastidiosum sp.]